MTAASASDPPDDPASRLDAQTLWSAFGFAAAVHGAPIAAAFAQALRERPDETRRIMESLYARQWSLWQRFLGPTEPPPADVPKADNASDGKRLEWFRFLRAQHEVWQDWSREFLALLALSPFEHRRIAFAVKQALDAADPDNTLATNPLALQRAIETGGESVARGLSNLARDLDLGTVTQSGHDGCRLGIDLAATPGNVVHATPIAQLLHFDAPGPRVRRTPLLIVPPFINKYYILDLRAGTSFVRFAAARGFDVFLLSWADPLPDSAWTWDDYVEQGVVAALDEIVRITREPKAHVLGYCVGGTLSTTALAVEAACGRERVQSLTLLATLLDFRDTGDIAVYVDEASVGSVESEFADGGVMEPARIAAAFSSLRARELVWHFVRHNYLLGEDTPVNDFLHWNGDGTAVPGPLFAFYLRHMYLENRLVRPGEVKVCGAPVDLGLIDVPTYVLAARGDHIVPWASAYDSARHLGSAARFVLAQSGHVAGIVNPPEPPRRGYWTGPAVSGPAEEWFERAQPHPGSWWHDWAEWLGERSGTWRQTRNARQRERVLEPAPGSYVAGRRHARRPTEA